MINYQKTHHSKRPVFSLYPKRKHSHLQQATIYLRVTYRFYTLDRSLGLKIQVNQWDPQLHRLKGSSIQQTHLLEKYEEAKEKIMGAYYLLSQSSAETTLREIFDLAFPEETKSTYSLFGVFQNYLINKEKQCTQPRQRSNLLKCQTCKKHLQQFVKDHLRVNDIPFSKINRNFIDDFEIYLKTRCNNGHNSAMKMLQIFKTVYKIAVDNRWIAHNAFTGKRLSFKFGEIEVLNSEEINKLKQAYLDKAYLDNVRQIFLFCTYTGLSYVDTQELRRSHLEYFEQSGQYFIRKKRQKTGVEFIVPLFQPAEGILERWTPNWETAPLESLMVPRISNQKYNYYLKELFTTIGIAKKGTSHLARHSFATSVALQNGVPIESVSKMLGHTKITQTQRYAKVTTLKIETETRQLFEKLKSH